MICLSPVSQASNKASVGNASNTDTPGQKEHELLHKLEKHHMCSACNKPCCVLSNGEHYVYSIQDLLTWAFLLVSLLFEQTCALVIWFISRAFSRFDPLWMEYIMVALG